MGSQFSQIAVKGGAGDSSALHRLLAVSENKKSGLILCKGFHAEFAGPGAALAPLVEQECVSIIAIGSPEIVEVVTHEDRQKAYSRRIQWLRWLQKITDHPDPLQRIERLFSGLEAFFGNQVLQSLPDEALALLIGVLPPTIATVRSQRASWSRELMNGEASADAPVVTVTPQNLEIFGAAAPFVLSARFLEQVYNLPYSA